jgi:saccharopine dehydrogenase-like NADP-dependent oxidoreductase
VTPTCSEGHSKILVLGAAGRAGHAVTSTLLTLGNVGRVFLADGNAEGLGKMVTELDHLPVSPRFLEAEREANLRERMAEADLVIGCLGPFHRYEGRVMNAAIALGKDYISLCDDPEAVTEALAMDGEATAKGVRILCGCGISPGLSNLLACRAASRFDSLESIELAWYLQPGSQLGTATVDHLLRSMSGKAPYYHHGRSDARSGSWEEINEFPPPIGRQPVSFLNHPEALTLPAVLDVPEIRFKGGVGGRQKTLLLETLGWMERNGGSELIGILLRSAARSILRMDNASCLASVTAKATGTASGREETRILGVVGDYYYTSAALVLAAIKQWTLGRLPVGVHPPERVLNDPSVFASLHAGGLRVLVAEAKQERQLPAVRSV